MIKLPNKKVVDNLEKFYNSRGEVINFFRDYAKMILDASYKIKQEGTKQEEREQTAAGLKILTVKKMLQILTIALAQVKAGNNSERLLNEIR